MAKEGKKLRCAVYARKSSEEGLEQDFNSLHAQREACEAYVQSQKGEGWVLLKAAYDDGGFSGGSMERPGLRRLLADVQAGLVDVVVVYKVDRLTRSITDFGRIVEVFDRAGASFVSITQAFNTTTSMGRLTLNVLLSFAQFEREVTGERIRDKIAQSKAKGMWMGGTVPLGYDVKDRALVVNAAEAETVRHIFRRYLELGSVYVLQVELEADGIRSKVRVTRAGKQVGGGLFSRGALYHLLQNRHYRGQIPHKDQTFAGQHAAIVEESLFDQVQAHLASNRVNRTERATSTERALLVGKIFTADSAPLSPSFSIGQRGRTYRYYVSGADAAVRRRLAAGATERFVLDLLRRIADRPTMAPEDVPLLLLRLELHDRGIQLIVGAEALFGLDHPELALEDLRTRLSPSERAGLERGGESVRIWSPAQLRFRGGRTWLAGVESQSGVKVHAPNRELVRALRSAHADLRRVGAPVLRPDQWSRDIKAPATTHATRLARMSLLAPDLQLEILTGRRGEAFSVQLMLTAQIPLAWEDQRIWIGSSARC